MWTYFLVIIIVLLYTNKIDKFILSKKYCEGFTKGIITGAVTGGGMVEAITAGFNYGLASPIISYFTDSKN